MNKPKQKSPSFNNFDSENNTTRSFAALLLIICLWLLRMLQYSNEYNLIFYRLDAHPKPGVKNNSI